MTAAPTMDDLLATVDVVDPYPLWQSLLDSGPVVSPDGAFALLSSHADCDAVLRSTRVSSDRRNSSRFQAVVDAMSEQDRKKQHDAQKQSSRDREKRARRFKELEDLIAAGEKQLAEMRDKLREDPAGDWAKLAKMAAEEQALAKRVDLLMTEWTKLGEELSG